jgi:hypothetical protein
MGGFVNKDENVDASASAVLNHLTGFRTFIWSSSIVSAMLDEMPQGASFPLPTSP